MTARAKHPTIRRVTTPPEWRTAEALLDEYVEELRESTGLEPFDEQPGFEAELAALRRSYGGPFGGLFVAWSGDAALGVVGLTCHRDRSAELKRLFVRPHARRNGIADRLIFHAIRRAGAHGCNEIWLECLRHAMDPAIRLCERNGFEARPARGSTIGLDDILVMSRELAPLQPSASTDRREAGVAYGLRTQRSSQRAAR